MRVLVSGGREYSNLECVFDVLDATHGGDDGPITTLYVDCETGAGDLALTWAEEQNVHAVSIEGKSERFGAQAYDCLIAFPGGRRTSEAVRLSHLRQIPVIEV